MIMQHGAGRQTGRLLALPSLPAGAVCRVLLLHAVSASLQATLHVCTCSGPLPCRAAVWLLFPCTNMPRYVHVHAPSGSGCMYMPGTMSSQPSACQHMAKTRPGRTVYMQYWTQGSREKPGQQLIIITEEHGKKLGLLHDAVNKIAAKKGSCCDTDILPWASKK